MGGSKADELRAIYSQLPYLPCQRKCQESCGPIAFSKLERGLVVKATGSAPKADGTLTCTKLVDGSCTIYRLRPLLCRLWGCVPAMRCPWGCVPEFWLTDEQGQELLKQSLKIGGRDDRGEKELLAALGVAVTLVTGEQP